MIPSVKQPVNQPRSGGYTCPDCLEPAPVGVGVYTPGARAKAESSGLDACKCGSSKR